MCKEKAKEIQDKIDKAKAGNIDSQSYAFNLLVVAAAILDIDGKLWTLPSPNRHHDIISFMRQSGYTGPVNKPDQQGFLLSNGIFCRRKPALKVAKEANQLKNGKSISSSMLFSEDVW